MTELIWEGKYDKDENKIAPLRVKLPFQTVETVNESAQQRQRTLDLFSSGRPAEWRNRLIWGDKKYVLPSLLEELAGQVNLIYIDPPFNTGDNFSFPVQVNGEAFTKEPSILEQKAYRDTWGRGLDSYLQWFYETSILLHELINESGSIYVHLDWRVGHYVKAVMDEVFGKANYQGEIIWQKLRSVKSQSAHFANMHDTIFIYTKTERFIFNPQFVEKDSKLLETHYRYTDPETGRRYNLADFTQAGAGPARRFGDKMMNPPAGKHWSTPPKKSKAF